MYSILATLVLDQICQLIFWWWKLRDYIKKYYPLIKWPAAIMGTFSQVTFTRLEKMKVTHQMNLAEAARLKFYDKLNFADQSQQEQTITEYKKMQKHFVNLQSRSKEIGKTSPQRLSSIISIQNENNCIFFVSKIIENKISFKPRVGFGCMQ